MATLLRSDTEHFDEFQSVDTSRTGIRIVSAKPTSPDDRRLSTHGVRIAFEDGFYIRWHHLITSPLDDHFQEASPSIDDGLHHSSQPARSEEKYDEYFDETFEKYRQTHPATSEHVHRRYSYSAKDCVGLASFLPTHGEKHESTAKCRTNATAFFISKEKLFHIFNTYSLWDMIWLEIGTTEAIWKGGVTSSPMLDSSCSTSTTNLAGPGVFQSIIRIRIGRSTISPGWFIDLSSIYLPC